MDYTYIIKMEETNLYKIGKTKNLSARHKQLRVGNPFFPDTFDYLDGNYESFLHKVFSDFRYKGEWFDIPLKKDDFLDLINTVIHADKSFEQSRVPKKHLLPHCRRIVHKFFLGLHDGMYVQGTQSVSGESIEGFIINLNAKDDYLYLNTKENIIVEVNRDVKILIG